MKNVNSNGFNLNISWHMLSAAKKMIEEAGDALGCRHLFGILMRGCV
ncbi:hypothetical protein SAMN05443245_4200 [Paraburkholderia fungorum]|uniref:Uncharacterized protein n=1 Tax=Paraburkholderia fungorum TaxID=134537 RepID=A0A1H1HR90_9BURK|nr:hypothetical protein [Paraburkholderia fungorum]SDR27933.1 hypothetical protein SAMN05443245_4200 [Paraburkholderia fungorum]